MKNISVAILFYFVLINIAKAQTNEKFIQLKKNEIDINAGIFTENFFSNGGENTFLDTKVAQLRTIRFGYKRHFRSFALRLKFEYVYNEKYQWSMQRGGNVDFDQPFELFNIKLGYERIKPQAFTLFEKKRNIDFYFGADLIAGYDDRYIKRDIGYLMTQQGPVYFTDVIALQRRTGIGASPFLGFRLPIRKHWSISAEIGLDMKAIIDTHYFSYFTKDVNNDDVYNFNQQLSLRNSDVVLSNDPSDVFSISHSSIKQNFAIGFHF
ncbi:MAG: hypothetical protein ABI772_05655 [Bacteroidota bacterium]